MTVYIKRLIALPFVTTLHAISMVFALLRFMALFMKYGGEWITYDRNHTKINDVYEVVRRDVNNLNETDEPQEGENQ